jgi:hypothetical protein
VRAGWLLLIGSAAALATVPVCAQSGGLIVPQSIHAGSAFSIQSTGSGKGTLYIVGLGQALKRDVQLGTTVWFQEGSLYNAGRYTVVLTGGEETLSGSIEVVPSGKLTDLSFLARPSRLAVGIADGITGAVYLFDAYRNLMTSSVPVTFVLTDPSGATQSRTAATDNGSAWIAVNSTAKEGTDDFMARSGSISTTRVIRQVPGDPCGLKMNVKPVGAMLELETDPVRDCGGNAVPDGTVVTFTETYNGEQSTVDVPIKRDIAQVEMPVHRGATITVASGVILGNQVRWEK